MVRLQKCPGELSFHRWLKPPLPISPLIRPYVSGGFLTGISVCLTSLRYVNPCQDVLVSPVQRGWKAGTFPPLPTLCANPSLSSWKVPSPFPRRPWNKANLKAMGDFKFHMSIWATFFLRILRAQFILTWREWSKTKWPLHEVTSVNFPAGPTVPLSLVYPCTGTC